MEGTEEGNKLIAEFMKLEKREATGVLYERYKWTDDKFYPDNLLKYHSSWDWLLPVWFKFVKLEIWKSKSSYLIGFTHDFYIALKTQEIKNCWKVLVEGIKWYNHTQ